MGLGLLDVVAYLGGCRIHDDTWHSSVQCHEACPINMMAACERENIHPNLLAASVGTFVPSNTASASFSSNTSSISCRGKEQHTSAFNTNSLLGLPFKMASLK